MNCSKLGKFLRINTSRLIFVIIFSGLLASSVITITFANFSEPPKIWILPQDANDEIMIEITHPGPITTGCKCDYHYIDMIQTDIDGQLKLYDVLPDDQINDTIALELSIDGGKEKSFIRARAHCNLNGWGPWSEQIQIPEFPEAVPILTISLIYLLLVRYSTRIRSMNPS